MRKFYFKSRWNILLLVIFPWFFIGGPGDGDSRIFKEVWNLGHILFFAVFALEADRYYSNRGFARQSKYLSIISIILVVATIIEICQSLLPGRVASLLDIIFGLNGGLAVLIWKDAKQKPFSRKIVLRAFGLSGIALCMIPLLLVNVDEYREWRDFPMLSDFESFMDVSRWEAKGRIERVKKPVKSGSFALKIDLNTDKYSGIFLHYFPEDWSKAQALTFSVYNPGKTIALHYRLHDWKHCGEHQDYSDRFNGHTDLHPGWNTIRIDIDQIKNGPKNRKMDINHIRGFGLFVVELPVAKIFYLDDVKLLLNEPNENL